MKNTLIIPSKIKSTVPKPTKTQILEALLAKAQERHNKAYADWNAKQHAIEDEIKELVRLEIPKLTIQHFDIDDGVNCYSRSANPATVRADIKTPAITRKQEKLIIHNKKQPKFDRDEMKIDLRKKLEAPNPLLNNPSVGKALEELLDQMTGKPKAIEAQEVEVVS